MTSPASYHYKRSQRLLEYASVATFVLLAVWSFGRLIHASNHYFGLIVLPAAFSAWLIVDILSGLLHFALDTFGSVHTPIIGNAFIRPFREHHVNPEEMTQHDFFELNGSSCFACLPILGFSVTIDLSSFTTIYFQALLLFIALGAFVTNECHKWAHTEASLTPHYIRWAQSRRLVLPPEHHALHHAKPFNSHFCMTNGWLNKPLNACLRLWKQA
jgi:Lipid desaturase domain